MSKTYNATLATDKDWVRFLVGDRNVSEAILEDEEIAALLVEEPNKYLAAARAAEAVYSRTGGIVEKQVGDLQVKYASSSSQAYRDHIKALRERGALVLLPKPKSLRVL